MHYKKPVSNDGKERKSRSELFAIWTAVLISVLGLYYTVHSSNQIREDSFILNRAYVEFTSASFVLDENDLVVDLAFKNEGRTLASDFQVMYYLKMSDATSSSCIYLDRPVILTPTGDPSEEKSIAVYLPLDEYKNLQISDKNQLIVIYKYKDFSGRQSIIQNNLIYPQQLIANQVPNSLNLDGQYLLDYDPSAELNCKYRQ